MDVLIKYNQTRIRQGQRKHDFARSSYAQMEIKKMSKGLVNFSFDVPECSLLPAYRIDVSKLLQRWREHQNCCNGGVSTNGC
jgi:hypothetical protein